MGSKDFLQRIIDIEKEIKPARWPGCYIYKIPDSLRELNKDAYSPLLISIGPVHHGKERLEGMQEQKHRYFRFFRERLKNESDLKRYKTFLEGKEQSIRHCYQQEFSDGIKKEVKVDDNKKEVEEPFLSIILLDAVFIMELFLREVEAREDKEHKEDDYIITRPYLSKIVRRDLLLLENQLPIYVLDELYDYVPCKAKKHTRFLRLAHEYFKCVYPDPKPPEERMFEPKWEKSLHFTDLIRRSCLPMKPSYDNDMSHHLCCPSRATSVGYGHRHSSQKECMLRTATKLNEAGISFVKVHNHGRLLNISFERKPFYGWFLCLGCLPYSKWFKARLQFPQLKVDHTTECVLRNLIAFEQCHYPDKPYICNYVSLVDSLIHTKDDAELLVEKEAIVHELGSDKELATLVNSLCKHVVTNKTCYHQIIRDLNHHYNNPWKWAMGTLRWVYFRDPWRSSSTIVGIAVLIFTIFNFCRVIRVVF